MNAWAIRLLAGLALLAVAYGAGWQMRGDHEQAAQLDQALAYANEIVAQQTRSDQIVRDYIAVVDSLKDRSRIRNVEVIRETEKIEYRCPLPDGGRLHINAAVRDANAAALGHRPALPGAP